MDLNDEKHELTEFPHHKVFFIEMTTLSIVNLIFKLNYNSPSQNRLEFIINSSILMEYQSFLMETFFYLKKIHWFFIIMENKSNENLMKNILIRGISLKNNWHRCISLTSFS